MFTFNFALFLIFFAVSAKTRVLIVSVDSSALGLILATIIVLLFLPKESLKRKVILESRKGTYTFLPLDKRLMTFERVLRERLICLASLSC